MSRLEGRAVVCSPEQLRLHSVLRELDCAVPGELNEAARRKTEIDLEPVLITTNGIILAGFGRWWSAVLQGKQGIQCIEVPISEERSLEFILAHHQPRRTWNAFLRIRMALTLEPYFQRQGLENMRAGGRCKGSADLPNPQLIDVRQQIARTAAVCARNVSNVKTILRAAHPRILAALQNGTLTINFAMQLCRLPKAQQLEHFTLHHEEREMSKVIRQSIRAPKEKKTGAQVATVLDALQRQEAIEPGSVLVRQGRSQHSIVLVGKGLHMERQLEKELERT